MSSIYFFSGACGCGKTTLSDAFAKQLVDDGKTKQVYIIHGDSFHAGFVEPEGDKNSETVSGAFLCWEEILKFNWECIDDIARKALGRGLDVIIDYVIEDELPTVRKMAEDFNARLYYIVLTAAEDSIRERISRRGDTELTERALFLKHKLDGMEENIGHLFDNTGMTVEEELKKLNIENFAVK